MLLTELEGTIITYGNRALIVERGINAR
jgi:hypothetical protein